MRTHLPLFERNRSTAAQAAIYRRFKTVVEELATDELSSSNHVGTDDHVFAFAIGGMFATLEQWCERGCLVSDEQMIEALDGHLTKLLDLDPNGLNGSR